ncbi:family 78 glycoside hydrolase catalytic domain [Paenibacillus thalictri]|uniref:alpha-L-rhamnosidase n=1 Tax=Paenibacillus thalictri TaxID=2527873 RepID=A0A4Q9DTJ7_9BACL|nr:family 78 glycoside hydrolase catalytic domain [Paenibacillus thalictri]TBL79020.1 alpha-L-rhamnosidase [Paenibacillus thalictri]
MKKVSVYDLRCEYKRNPLGMDVQIPRFFWKLSVEAQGAKQSAYRIQVSTHPYMDGAALLWDSGVVDTDQSVHVDYAGTALKPRTRYWYRVRVKLADGTESDWSETAYWETGLMSPQAWQAAWITAELPASPSLEEDPCHYVRTAFTLHENPVSARVYATAHGVYRLFLNGRDADDTRMAPGWTSYHKRLQYQSYDVTELLTEGSNALGVVLGNGWYSGNLAWTGGRSLYGKERGLLLELHVTYADGSEQCIFTDADGNWKASEGALRMSEIYHGETYDARQEAKGWAEPHFNDAAWTQVQRQAWSKDLLIAQENEPVRVIQELLPIRTLRTPKGETVLDLGQNMVGWMRFTVNEAPGTVIRLQHAEVLDKEGNFYTGNLRTAKQTVTYICHGEGEETFEPLFSFQGFRYVLVEGVSEDKLEGRFVGCVAHSDLEPAGSFETSDELLNQLWRNILWGQKGNFLDVPTDCPQRDERLGWTGDAQVFIRTSTFLMDVAPFFTKWLRDLAADQLKNGGVPFVIPFIPFNDQFTEDDSNHSSSAWGDAAVICPWTMYEVYGDVRLLKQQYPSMKAWVEYIHSRGDNEFLWNTGFHFGDWLALDGKDGSYIGQTPTDLIATAFYAHCADLLSRSAEALGYSDDAAAYRELHRNVVENFRKEFVSPNGRVIAPTQTAYVLALMFDLLEERHRERAAGILASLIEKNDCKLTTGFVGTPYLCPVLTRYGYNDLAYKLVLQKEYPSWLYSVTQGATTIWEHWDGIKPDGSFWSDNMNSYNHYAYGSVGEWLYRSAAGIDTLDGQPGYKRFRIAPQFGEQLNYVRASYESIYGTIRSSWEKNSDGSIDVEITVPANTEAVVVLPGHANQTVGSGTYRFECKLEDGNRLVGS